MNKFTIIILIIFKKKKFIFLLRYSLADPGPFIRLWMFSLTQINDWTRELSIIYLLDILLRKAFFFKEAKQEAIDILTSLFQVIQIYLFLFFM